jgi:tRNA (adenine57-N1/adenine58-N1)-methyltransferase catalytic subunit
LGWNLHGTHALEGDLVQLVGLRHKSFIFLLRAGGDFQSHRGVIRHDDIIGRPWGSAVTSHNGSPFFMLQPALVDLLRNIKRSTQILYPKDIGFILTTMGIGPGQHVLEAGTGSGAFTTALAYAVGPEGRVTTYETREPFQQLAKSNLIHHGLAERVTFKLGDIFDGFGESGVDALFLDVANPYDYIRQVRGALKPGGFFGSILPTANQVTLLLKALRDEHFAFIDVCEVLLRYYRVDPERFRPTDRMVAHTGYLIFARPVLVPEGEEGQLLLEENAEAEPIEDLGGR